MLETPKSLANEACLTARSTWRGESPRYRDMREDATMGNQQVVSLLRKGLKASTAARTPGCFVRNALKGQPNPGTKRMVTSVSPHEISRKRGYDHRLLTEHRTFTFDDYVRVEKLRAPADWAPAGGPHSGTQCNASS